MKTKQNETRKDTGFVVGYKFFHVGAHGALVGGLGNVMPGRYDTAICANGRHHKAPAENCSCGHYLRWEPDHFFGTAMAQCVAYGKVWLWTEGCRAEKIRIDCIYVRSRVPENVRQQIAERYGVPVIVSDA